MRKFLVYLLTYFVMLVSGMCGVMLFTNTSVPSRAVQVSEPTVFDKIVGNITASKSLSADVQVAVKEKQESFANVNLKLEVDLIDGFSNFNLNGEMNVERQGKALNIAFAYVDGQIYLDLIGAKYQVTTDDIGVLVQLLSVALKDVMPNFDLASVLDVNMLMDLMQNIEEAQTEAENVLKLTIPFGNIVIKTDKAYNIKSVAMPTITLGNYSFKPVVKVENSKESLGISKPQNADNYNEISKQFDIITAFMNTISTPFRADLEIEGVNVDLNYDKNGISLTAKDGAITATYIDSILYLKLGELGLTCDEQDAEILKQLLGDKLKLLGITKEKIINFLLDKFKNFDLSKITLKMLNDIEFDENGALNFEYEGFKIKLASKNSKLESAEIEYLDHCVRCTFDYQNVTAVVKPNGKFLTLTQMLDIVTAGKNTVLADDLVSNAEIMIDDLKVTATINYSFDGGNIYLNANANINGKNVVFTFVNETVYIEYQGVKLKANEQTIAKLLAEYEHELPKTPDIDALKDLKLTDKQTQALLKLLTQAFDCVSKTTAEMKENVLEIINSGAIVKVSTKDEKISNISVQYKDYAVYASIGYQTFEKVQITDEEYTEISVFIDVFKDVIDKLQNGAYAEFELAYEGITVEGFVNLVNKKLSANCVITYEECSLIVKIVDEQVFVDAFGAKIKFNISDIDRVMQLLDEFGVVLLNLEATRIDYGLIDGVINKLYFNFADSKLNIDYDTWKFSVDVNNNKLNGFDAYQGKTKILGFVFLDQATDVTIEGEYFDVIDLIELVQSVNTNEVFANLEIVVGEYNFDCKINYSNNNLQASLSTEIYNKRINAVYLDKVIYIDIDGLKFKLALKDADKVMAFVTKVLNKDINFSGVGNLQLNKDIIKNYLNKVNLSYEGEKIVVKIDGFDLKDVGLDLSKIDLCGFGIDQLKIDLDKMSKGNVQLTVDCGQNTVSGVAVGINDYLQLIANLTDCPHSITVDTNEYLDFVSLIPYANSLVDVYEVGVVGTICIENQTLEKFINSLNVDFAFNKNGVELSTVLFGNKVSVTIIKDEIYLQISELKYKFAVSEIDKLIDQISKEFGFEISLNGFDLNKMRLGDIQITESSGTLTVNYNGIILEIRKENALELNLLCEGTNVTVLGTYKNKTITINNDEFLPILNVIDKISSVYSVVKNGKIALDLDFSYNNNCIKGVVNIDVLNFLKTKDLNDLKLSATLVAFEKNIGVVLINKTLYIDLDGMKIKFNISDIDEIINWVNNEFNLQLKPKNIDIDLDKFIKSISETSDNGIEILTSLFNGKLTFINNQINGIKISRDDILINLKLINDFEEIEVKYVDLYSNTVEILPLCSKILQLYREKAISVDFEIYKNLLGYDQAITGSVKVDYSDKLMIDLFVAFQGLNANIYLRNNYIYVDLANLKIKICENDLFKIIEFANDNFNANLIKPEPSSVAGNVLIDFINKNLKLGFELPKLDKIKENINSDLSLDFNKIIDRVKDINFGKIGKFTMRDNVFSIGIGLSSTTINLSKNFEVNFDYKDLIANLNVVETGKLVACEDVTKQTFAQANEILGTLQDIINTLKEKQYKVSANTQVYNGLTKRFDGSIDASLDLTNSPKFSGFATLKGEQDISVKLDYDGAYIYIDYSGLKVKIHQNNIKEIAGIVLAVFGYDINSLGIFGDVDLGNLNLDNIKNAIPTIDFGNPLEMLKVIKSINYSDGAFAITLDGKKVSGNDNAKAMELNIGTQNGMLSHFNLKNMYTKVTIDEYFDLNIDFVKFSGIQEISGKYFDISSSSTLLKSLINTSEMNDYHITATIKAKIAGIPIEVPLDAQIKIVDKKPLAMVNIGEIPVVVGVNKSIGDGTINDRYAKIYYYDEMVYVSRTEKRGVISKKPYELRTKVHYTTFVNDIGYYLQYVMGFEDSIMDAIYESLEKSKGHVIPMDEILVDYNYTDSYNLVINMKAISNDSNMGNMTVNIYTNSVGSESKDYVTDMKFNLHMDLGKTNSFKGVSMDLGSSNIKLNVGDIVDTTSILDYINNYPYAEGQEWETKDGKSNCVKSVNYKISFVANGGADILDLVTLPNSSITLPTYANRQQVIGSQRITYRFDGWYKTINFKQGTEFKNDKMPRENITLYAKWTEIKRENNYTITFVTNGGTNIDALSEYEGCEINLPTYNDRVSVTDTEKTTYHFDGWFTSETFEENTRFDATQMPSENITLYAKWTKTQTLVKYSITFVTNGGTEQPSIQAFETEPITLPTYLDRYVEDETSKTTYRFDGWFTSETFEENTKFEAMQMPSANITLYAKWTVVNQVNSYTLTLVNESEQVQKLKAYENDAIVLPTYKTTVTKSSNATTTRTFLGWFTSKTFEENTKFEATQMPSANITLYAKWQVEVEYTYTLTFNVNGGNAMEVSSIEAIAGKSVNISEYVPTKNTHYVDKGYNAFGKNAGKWTYEVTTYTFGGWYTDSSCKTVFDGTMPFENITLYAKWNSSTTTKYYYNWERPKN